MAQTGIAEPLIAYLHLRPGAGQHTRAVLEGHVRSFARREGFDLLRILVGADSGADPRLGLVSALGLLEQIELTGTSKVLVVGPARQALAALSRMAGVQVLTLAQVRPASRTTP